MSTDLKSRSKAYTLTRVGLRANHVGIVVSQGWNRPSLTLSIPEIEDMFRTGEFGPAIESLSLLDETIPLLRLDLAQFALTKGHGMEAGTDYASYTAETYTVVTSGETGWCVKYGDDNICDVYAGEAMAKRIAEVLNMA